MSEEISSRRAPWAGAFLPTSAEYFMTRCALEAHSEVWAPPRRAHTWLCLMLLSCPCVFSYSFHLLLIYSAAVRGTSAWQELYSPSVGQKWPHRPSSCPREACCLQVGDRHSHPKSKLQTAELPTLFLDDRSAR